jgi:hypothetical protein
MICRMKNCFVTTNRGAYPLLVAFIALFIFVGHVFADEPFTDNGNGTVTDNQSRMMWQKDEGGRKFWEPSMKYCGNLSLGEHSDWRLPSKEELTTLWNNAGSQKDKMKVWFPRMKASGYWSSTILEDDPAYAWYVYFGDGVPNNNFKTFDNNARCIRNGK